MNVDFPRAAMMVAVFGLALSGQTASADPVGLVRYGTMLARPEAVIPGIGTIVRPESGIEKPEDIGVRAHPHSLLLIPDHPVTPPQPGSAVTLNVGVNPLLTKSETPASLACVYRLVSQSSGCDPSKVSKVATGGSKVIVIVDAFHNRTMATDLKYFSSYFKLPAPHLQVVYCSATSCNGVTTPPPVNQGWALEIALDLDAAHAMAPNAKLILVEAFSNSYNDLMRAEDRAAELAAAAGGGQVSNSWGGTDFAGETSLDFHFIKNKVVFFASTGDHKGGTNVADVEWPSTSPNVVAVGGTTIVRTSSGAFSREEAWLNTGGGLSAHEKRPGFQKAVASRVGTHRGVPDIAANADGASGMYVRCSPTSCGGVSAWHIVGGTSLAAPLVAAITNNSSKFHSSSLAELIAIYGGLGGPLLNDINRGKCGNSSNGGFSAALTGWDRCTGVGTPKGKTLL